MHHPIITLTSDFGYRDPYVAEMKGVILSISPQASIIDISHQVDKFNIQTGAFLLSSVASYYPKGTIHVAVVDPGVGTSRKALLIETTKQFFIGPDNGVLAPVVHRQGIQHIYHITNFDMMLPKISPTFHGRDVFAPMAAHLANGISPSTSGPELQKITLLELGGLRKKNGIIWGEVIHIDDFGNLITNIPVEELGLSDLVNLVIQVKNKTVKLSQFFAEKKKKELLAIIGSHGQLEISVNQGSAAKKLNVKIGDPIKILEILSYPQ